MLNVHAILVFTAYTSHFKCLFYSRYPTLVSMALGKLVINAAVGFESFVVMRHGLKGQERRLGCYFCSDIVSPQNVLSPRPRSYFLYPRFFHRVYYLLGRQFLRSSGLSPRLHITHDVLSLLFS